MANFFIGAFIFILCFFTLSEINYKSEEVVFQKEAYSSSFMLDVNKPGLELEIGVVDNESSIQ